MTADQVLGNRLRIEQPVVVHIGSPDSPRTVIWPPGFLSPPVYSWVQKNGAVWWQIGEIPPIRFVKHDKDRLDVEADFGGGKFLKDPQDNGSIGLDALGGLFDTLSLKNLGRVAKIGIGIGAFFIGWKLFDVAKKLK